MRLLRCLLAVASFAPAVSSAQAATPAAPTTIVTRLGKAEASERVTSALVDAGYTIADATPTVVRTGRRTFQNIWDLQLRANILVVDSSTSRVVVTGVYWVTCCGMLKRDNVAAEESHRGVSGKMWEQVALAADRIRAALPPAPPMADSTSHP
jgi:hypothetical protein